MSVLALITVCEFNLFPYDSSILEIGENEKFPNYQSGFLVIMQYQELAGMLKSPIRKARTALGFEECIVIQKDGSKAKS